MVKRPYHVALSLTEDSVGWATLDDQFKPLAVYDYVGDKQIKKSA